MRREAAENLARLGHPEAPDILRRLLEDPRTDDSRTRRYVCGLLGDHPSPHIADVVTCSSRRWPPPTHARTKPGTTAWTSCSA